VKTRWLAVEEDEAAVDAVAEAAATLAAGVDVRLP
jgi:hypothetical protein